MTTDTEALPPIERDEHMDRTYIPLPGGWEVQTKGKGSTFRLCDTKSGDRWPVLEERLHEALERMAREVRAALAQRQQVPEGWKLVPVEPTIGMCIAGDQARHNVSDLTRTPAVYRAMLSAAPSLTAAPQAAEPRDTDALPDLCSISKPLADFPEPVAYINMKTGQVKSLATLNREKPPGHWWPFNLQEQIHAALSASPQAPAAQPVEPLLFRDLALEMGVSVATLTQTIARRGLGNFSVNMAVPVAVAKAVRDPAFGLVRDAAPAAQPVAEGARYKKAIVSCADCDHCTYRMEGRYQCDATGRHFAGEGRPTALPDWCPLPALAAPPAQPHQAVAQPRLTVRVQSFPESNGKRNWTALLMRVDPWDGLIGNCGGITIDRGEFWNRVAYEAERAKLLIGERDTEPDVLDYGDDIKTPELWEGEVRGGRPVPEIRGAAAAEPKCSPTLTECPRCKNVIGKCDGILAATPSAPLDRSALLDLFDAYAESTRDGVFDERARSIAAQIVVAFDGQWQDDADPNAPWLTEAHMLCTDQGIAAGHITERLRALREKLAAQSTKRLTAERLDKLIQAHVGGAELADGEYSAMVTFAAAVERALQSDTEE